MAGKVKRTRARESVKRSKSAGATRGHDRESFGARSVWAIALLASGGLLGLSALTQHSKLQAWQTPTLAWLPFAAVAAALLLLPQPNGLRVTAIVFVVGAALLPVLLSPPQYVGDAGEYYQMSAAFANHATPDLRSTDTSGFATAADAQGMQATGGSLVGRPLTTGYYRAENGAMYSYHFWLSALAAVPFSAVLGVLGLGALKQFQVMNATLFVIAFIALLLWSDLPLLQRRAFAAFWALSPVLWYVGAVSAEVWSASWVVIGIVLFTRKRYAWAVFAIALGAAQNPPLVVMALLVAAIAAYEAYGERRRRDLAFLGLALLPVAVPYAFYYATFGVPNLIVSVGGASTGAITARKVFEVFFDFDQGVLPYAPALMLLSLAGVAWGAVRRDWLVLALAGASIAMAVLSAMSTNWNAGSIGLMRYAVWQLPILAWIVVRGLGDVKIVSTGAFTVLVGAQLVVFLVASFTPAFAPAYLQHGYLGTFVLDSIPSAYSPTPEVFAERTLHREDSWAEQLPISYSTSAGLIRKALMRVADEPRAAGAIGVDVATLRPHLSSAGQGLDYVSIPPGTFGQ